MRIRQLFDSPHQNLCQTTCAPGERERGKGSERKRSESGEKEEGAKIYLPRLSLPNFCSSTSGEVKCG